MASVRDSQKDLISVTVSDAPNGAASGLWTKRLSGQRKLMGGLAVTVLVCMGLVVALVVVSTTKNNKGELERHTSAKLDADVCMTEGCIGAAHMLLQNMNRTADPCEDFYEFSCGGFEKRVVIPDDRSSRSQFAIIGDELLQQLRVILEDEGHEGESHVFTMARNVYKACMDEEKIENIGLEPLKDMLKSMGGWPVLQGDAWNEETFNWIETVYTFRSHGYSTDYLIDFSIVTDSKNSSWRVIDIDQASLGMSREYLINGFEDDDVTSYYNYMVSVAELLGADRKVAEKELKESLLFEIELAHASKPREERRNASRLYNPMMIKDLHEHAPMVPWLEYINNILTTDLLQVEETERVILDEPGYLKNLTNLLPKTNNRTIANYMFWRVARSSLGYFTEAARKVQLEYAKNITGTKSQTPRWRQCTGSASGSFASPIGNMYVTKHFNEDAKHAMDEMVRDIRHEFDRILNEISWMDGETRERARKKLSTMKEYIGYPKEIMIEKKLEDLYENLHVNSGDHFINGINMSIWGTNYAWGKLREKIDKTDWKRHGQPAVVNAFYSSIENSIQFPAGILQGNFFGSDRPSYMNYGGIGWVIGHEITHGFDDQGRQFDDEGNLANWWEDATKDKFLDKANCIIWQYGNYTADSVNKTLNGVNTQGENIADNGGIKEAYRAYDSWVNRHGAESRLPGLQNYTPHQMFWISAANTWCSKYRDKALEKRIKTGAHSPGMFRVQGPFSNSKEFANDFKCPLGSKMNPVKKCEVW
eukprot:TRINITY_DN3177_c0_g1_i1.p1 TRINITY_DN3177_c0_g1~~TRINITY_DN3177_c0_g1_i1.p1  ORF type:complete len:763 (-),score=121.64 TRINITY_DN3177_c0_g1_i1:74-2362(-)